MRPSVPGDPGLPGVFPNREQSLVLHAAIDSGDDALHAYQEWRASFDIAQEFDRHVFRLIPLLYDNLRHLGHHDALTGRLKGAYRLAWAKNQRLFEDTRPILGRFIGAGLRVMAIKGAALALEYYGNVAVRPMSDLDLVVPAAQAETAAAILLELGYDPWRALDSDVKRFRHAVRFTAPGPKEMDLHWHMLFDLPDEKLDEEFWATARPFRFLDHDIVTPDSTRALLHTILHGLRWNEEPPIRWIPDAMMILRRDARTIDWAWLVSFAERRCIAHRLHLGLAYLAGSFAAPIPQHVLSRLSGIALSWVERLENHTVLRPVRYESALGPILEALTEFPRLRADGSAAGIATTFLHFLRYHWGLRGRRDIPRYLLRGMLNRARRAAGLPERSDFAT
jgi:hypothetical protein